MNPRSRVRLLAGLLALPVALVLLRLAQLQLVPSRHREAVEQAQHFHVVLTAPRRGRILSSGGAVLAGNAPRFVVDCNYRDLYPRDVLVEILAEELGGEYTAERIESRVVELALGAPAPAVEGSAANCGGNADWEWLLGPVDRSTRRRIERRWRDYAGTRFRRLLRFCPRTSPASGELFDLYFEPNTILSTERVLGRLADSIAVEDGREPESVESELWARVREIRERFDRRTTRAVGSPPAVGGVGGARRHREELAAWRRRRSRQQSRLHAERILLARDVSLAVVTEIEYHPETFAGLLTRSETQRVYPEADVSGSLLGYLRRYDPERDRGAVTVQSLDRSVLRDPEAFARAQPELWSREGWTGQGGIEESYDRALRGAPGVRLARVGSSGALREVVDEVDAIDGLDVRTTIELELQRLLHRELVAAVERPGEFGGKRASAVVLHIASGAILAAVGVPSFDPGRIRDRDYVDEMNARWGPRSGWRMDRPTRHAAVPGSVFKLVLGAAALEGGFEPGTTLPCDGKFRDTRWRCNAQYGHGGITLTEAIGVSCNNYFYALGLDVLGAERIHELASAFGFGLPTGVDLPGRSGRGLLTAPDGVRGLDVCHLSIGHVHVTATTLQVARSVAAIASNEETLPRPFLVEPTGPPAELALSRATKRELRRGMWHAAQRPGGTAAKVHYGLRGVFRVAAKTGTAQLSSREARHNAWIAGFAPASESGRHDPPAEIAFALVVEDTPGSGGEVTAPIIARVLEYFAARDARFQVSAGAPE